MLENIFITDSIVNTNNFRIYINNYRLNSKKLVDDINLNPGFLFVLDRISEKLYVGEIISITKKGANDIQSENVISLTVNYEEYSIYFNGELKLYPIMVLEILYSRNRKSKLGEKEYSIFSTYYRRNFKFARPIIHNYDFLLTQFEDEKFKSKILYDYSIFSTDKGEKIYGKAVEEDGEIFLSLTNDKMLDVDFKFLEDGDSNYRPYFYEFYLDNFIEEQFKRAALVVDEIYEIEIKINHKKKIKGEEINVLNGQLLFSASPIVKVPAHLRLSGRISTSEKRKIEQYETTLRNRINKISNTKLIQEEVMECFKGKIYSDINFEITVYNVGQGNWINIEVSDQDNVFLDIVFDIGLGKSGNLNLTKYIASKAAKKLNDNHLFILSHWDLDHIKGIAYLTDQQFNTTWIVPNLPEKLSFSALRLATYLYKKPFIKEVFIDDSLNNQMIFDSPVLMLGKGEGLNSNVITERNGYRFRTAYTSNNNLGLLLSIKNEDKEILLSGDCEYLQFPIEFIKSYEAILMSHHGAKIKVTDLSNLGFTSSSSEDSKAIVCVGKDMNYPDNDHKVSIEELGYSVLETRNYKNFDTQIKIKLPARVGV